MLQGDDVEIASRRCENINFTDDGLHGDPWKPSMHACNAQIGSISVTRTRAPAPL